MLSSMASGAILSKTRAMFGRRLKREDYVALSQKRNIEEAASYLANLDAYRDMLRDRKGGDMHRRELEVILRHGHFRRFESLCRYELSIGAKLSDYILLTTEIELITEALSRVISPRTEEAVMVTASPYLDKLLKLDLAAMGRAKSYDELLLAVKDSVFYDVLKRLGWHPTGELVTYEIGLYAEFYRRVFDVIDDSLSGKEREALRDIFISKIDLENLVRIIRFKGYFPGATPEIIRTSLIPHGNVMRESAVKLVQCRTQGEVLAAAEKMRFFRHKLDHLDKCLRIDELSDRYILKRCFHEMYFSTYPSVVMVSYLNLSEIEIANIIKIVEGIRYGVSPDSIMDMLILPE